MMDLSLDLDLAVRDWEWRSSIMGCITELRTVASLPVAQTIFQIKSNQIKYVYFRQQGPYNYNYNTEKYNRPNKELSIEKQTQ